MKSLLPNSWPARSTSSRSPARAADQAVTFAGSGDVKEFVRAMLGSFAHAVTSTWASRSHRLIAFDAIWA